MTQTVTLPRNQYIRMVGTFSEVLVKEAADDEPRTIELRNSLKELTAAAKAANLRLDDEFVAKNEQAMRVRNAVDALMPEFTMLMERAQKRQQLIKYFKQSIETLPETEVIAVPMNDTLVLLGLAQAA